MSENMFHQNNSPRSIEGTLRARAAQDMLEGVYSSEEAKTSLDFNPITEVPEVAIYEST